MPPHKKYDVNFKLNAVRYAEQNSGEAAARKFGVDPKRVRDWKKNKSKLQELARENSSRSRLRGGGRKKVSEELEAKIVEWILEKRANRQRVSRRMIRMMGKELYQTVADNGKPFTASSGWLNRFLRRNHFGGQGRTTMVLSYSVGGVRLNGDTLLLKADPK